MVEKIIHYIIYKLGCASPFRISRILLLLDWASMEKLGRKLTNLTYKATPYAFYIEELPSILEKLEEKGYVVKNVERKCFEYRQPPPKVSIEISKLVDEILEKVKELSDVELNRLVIRDPRYRSLLGG